MRWLATIAALILALGGGTALAGRAETPVHYDVRATIGPEGYVEAEVVITLPKVAAGTARSFLLSRRFAVARVDAGRGASVSRIAVETPMEDLTRFDFAFATPGRKTLRFRYSGPLNTAHDSGVTAFRHDDIELFIDHFWIPIGADIQTMFTADARIEGLAPGLVVVGQGHVKRTRTGVRIHRTLTDVDLPMVAMAGLKKVAAPGVEFFARDLETPYSRRYVDHAVASANFFRDWFGPLAAPDPIRIVAVSRARRLGYTRTAYTVVNDTGRDDDPDQNLSQGRHIAHEIAHAWWRSASPLTDDFWLVESVAEYCAVRYVERVIGAEAAANLFEEKRTASASAGPVMGHGRPNRVQLYGKGPLLLLALEKRIGRGKIDALLVETARSRTPNTAAAFLAALARIATATDAAWFDAALHAEGLPEGA